MSTPASGARDLYLARQPVLDRSRSLVAFELLFRSGQSAHAQIVDDRSATANVILNAFFELGVEKVLGRHRGFLNLDAEMLLSDAVLLLPKELVILELLESVEIDEQVVERVRGLSQEGYMIALDDVVAFERVEELLPLTDFVKIDVLATPPEELAQLVARVRGRLQQGRVQGAKLVAEKVETHTQMRACLALGFDLFQGYYFARPEILTGRRLDRSKLALLELLALVQSEADTEGIEQGIRHHPQLAYDLMRIVNSVSLGLAEAVGTLRQAIVVLGRRSLLRWVQLLVYSLGAAGTGLSGRGTNPLMLLAATRGRLMEGLAQLTSPQDRLFHDQSYVTGIFSLLDALLGVPMAEIVEPLKPVRAIRDALLRREGRIGRLLELVEKLESNDRASVRAILAELGTIDEGQLQLAELEAMRWANEVTAS